jgi:hypothetical protein
MDEEASAEEENIQSLPFMIREQKAPSKGSRNIKVFSPPRSMGAPPPYDSERIPSRPDSQFSITTQSPRGEVVSGWNE